MRTYDIQTEVRNAQVTAVARTTLTVAEFGPWLSKIYPVIAGQLATRHTGPAGPPFARLRSLGDGRFDVEAGFPATDPLAADGPFGAVAVVQSELPGGRVAVTTHVGPYDQIEPAYQALAAWLIEHGGEPVGDPWEVYLSGPPTEPDPATWRTEVLQPYRQA